MAQGRQFRIVREFFLIFHENCMNAIWNALEGANMASHLIADVRVLLLSPALEGSLDIVIAGLRFNTQQVVVVRVRPSHIVNNAR